MENPTEKLVDASSPLFQEVIHLHQTGQLDAAEDLYQVLLETYPEDHRILSNLGTLYLQQGNLQKGIATIKSSLAFQGDQPHAHNSLGNALAGLGSFDESLWHFEKALQLRPEMVEALVNQANILLDLGRPGAALQRMNRALSISPGSPEYNRLRATILLSLTSYDNAISCLNNALALNPLLREAYTERGRALLLMGHPLKATESYNQALRLDLNDTLAYLGRGMALQELNRLAEAQSSFKVMICLNPHDEKALTQFGIVLYELKRYGDALSALYQGIEVNPFSFEAFTNRGNVFYELNCFKEAIRDHSIALELMPSQAQVYFNRATVFEAMGSHSLAFSDFRAAYRLNPSQDECLSHMLFNALKLMDWESVSEVLSDVTYRLDQDVNIGPPFAFLAAVDNPKMHQKIAINFLASQFKKKNTIEEACFIKPIGKIKVGYFSSDFREHPVALNLWPLIKNHDRGRFEVIAFDFSPRVSKDKLHPILKDFDQVHDILGVSDLDAANLARKLGLHIAIDLNGGTALSRTGIFVLGAAPIQVNYLGYPGTMGYPNYDYIIADKAVIPEAHREQYVERPLHLPHFFMPYAFNESREGLKIDRNQYSLPVDRFIFCSFNDFYKISQEIFHVWITLLASTQGTVLTIALRGGVEPETLLRKFESQGIASDRIILAQRTETHAEHLSRLGLCDLMLDTFPYNSHTTACDAVSAGLPILTIRGQSFASRVSSSLLEHIGIPELIAQNTREYCEKAIKMAEDAPYYQGLRDRLAKGRSNLPNALTYTRNLESLYCSMVNEKLELMKDGPDT